MASSLPNLITVIYNGFQFPLYTYIAGIEVKPNKDSAGRTVVSTTHVLTIVSTITPTGVHTNTDLDVLQIRNLLTPSAGNLQLVGVGFGTLNINTPGGGGAGVRDLSWGPHTRGLRFEQIGDDQAWRVTWEVEFTILDQCVLATYKNKPLSFNYKVGIDQDRSGYSRRTYSGSLVIPQTRDTVGSRALNDNADAYLERALPPVPAGWRRETQQRELDESKCKITFTILDAEMAPIPPPPDCVLANLVRHSTCRTALSFNSWVASIRGKYEFAKGVPKARAWRYFWFMVSDQLTDTRAIIRGAKADSTLIPVSLDLDSGDVHGREAGTFVYSYSYVIDDDKIDHAIRAANLWRLPVGCEFPAWATSMNTQDVSTPRGTAKYKFANSDDLLIDLCLNAGTVRTLPAGGSIDRRFETGGEVGSASDYNPFNMTTPAKDESWIGYESEMVVETLDNTVELKPLPLTPVRYHAPQQDSDSVAGFSTGWSNAPTSVTQYRGAPTIFVTLIGGAMRAGWSISPPQLTAIGGVPAVPCRGPGDYFRTNVFGNLGVPAIMARWRQRYRLAGVPRIGLEPPDHPLYGEVEGDGDSPHGLQVVS